MITVICGTNRPDSNTARVALAYLDALKQSNADGGYFSMEELPADFMVSESFGNRTEAYDALLEERLGRAKALVFVIPEYHGSYPGVLKAFLDAGVDDHIKGKRCAIVGVASGRAGNIRGIDHLMTVLHHLRAEVFHAKPKFSQIEEMILPSGAVNDEIKTVLTEHVKAFKAFGAA